MTILQTDTSVKEYTQNFVTERDTPNKGIPVPILHEIEKPADLPFGGNWYYVQLDAPDEIDLLPSWLTAGEMWIMKSRIIEAWYLWVPVKKAEGWQR